MASSVAAEPEAVFLTDFSMEPLPAFQPTPSIELHLEVPDGGDWMARGKAADPLRHRRSRSDPAELVGVAEAGWIGG